jgi:hypothetical protein
LERRSWRGGVGEEELERRSWRGGGREGGRGFVIIIIIIIIALLPG